MIEILHETDEGVACFGDQRMHRLKLIEKAPPGNLGDFVGHFAACLIRLPQRLPAQPIIWLDVSYDKWDSHRVLLFWGTSRAAAAAASVTRLLEVPRSLG